MTDSTELPTKSNRKRWLSTLIGIIVGGIFLYLAIRKVDLSNVYQQLTAINWLWLIPLLLVALIDFWFKSVRWVWIFSPQHRPTVGQSFAAFMVGVLGNNVLPGRMGDVMRVGFMSRYVPSAGVSGSLATVMLERVLDILVLVILLGTAFLFSPLPAWLTQAGLIGAVVILIALIALIIFSIQGKNIEKLTTRFLSKIKLEKITPTINGILHRFTTGLDMLRNGKQFVLLVGISLLIWLLEALLIYIAFLAFHLNLSFIAALVSLVVLTAGIMLPTAPGFIGTYQFFMLTALQIYHIPDDQAIAVGIFLNMFVFISSTLIGVITLLIERISWLFVRSSREN